MANQALGAWIRDEVVWIVLEISFIVIAAKGLWQARAALQQPQESDEGVPVP